MLVVIGVAVEFETSKAVMILKGNLRKDLVASGYYYGTSTFTTIQLGQRCANAMRGIKTKTLCVDNHSFDAKLYDWENCTMFVSVYHLQLLWSNR